jgi:HK97 family phage major capsid protein
MWIELLKAHKGRAIGDVYEVADEVGETLTTLEIAKASDEPPAALDATLEAAFERFEKSIATRFDRIGETIGRTAPARVESVEDGAPVQKSFNSMVRDIAAFQKHHDADAMDRLHKLHKCQFTDADGNILKSHEGAVGARGGVLIAPEYASELLKLSPETSVIADAVRTVPMSGETKQYPVLRQTGKNAPAGGSNMHGGVLTYRKSEKAQRTPSGAEFDFVELKATDLTAFTTATRDLLADAPGVESDFMSLIQEALAWRMDRDFLFGSGAGEPQGVYNAPATVSVFRKTVNLLAYVDFANLMSRVLPDYWGMGRWVCNVTAFPQIVTLKDDAGNFIFLPNSQGATSSPAGTILGRPVRFTEKAPTLGAAGDLAFIVPSLYLHGLRSGVEIAVSDQFLFDTDQIAYRAKLRNDGQPWMKAPFRQADGANTQLGIAAKLAATVS